MPGADMAEGIDDPLVRQDAVGGDDFFEDEIKLAHCGVSPLRLGGDPSVQVRGFASAAWHIAHSGSAPRDLIADLR